MLFGGFGRDNVYRGETWEWDGRQWTQAAADGPAPRARHRMVYDVMRGVTVLFGGDTGNPGPGRFNLSDETWLWDGTKWTKAAPQTAPSARMTHALAYDAGRSRVVLFGGGTGAAALSDTWEWDGVNWRQVGS